MIEIKSTSASIFFEDSDVGFIDFVNDEISLDLECGYEEFLEIVEKIQKAVNNYNKLEEIGKKNDKR